MKQEWLKTWWLGGDLNTRPRDYDFYVAVRQIVNKAANSLRYTHKILLSIHTELGIFYTLMSAQLSFNGSGDL